MWRLGGSAGEGMDGVTRIRAVLGKQIKWNVLLFLFLLL